VAAIGFSVGVTFGTANVLITGIWYTGGATAGGLDGGLTGV